MQIFSVFSRKFPFDIDDFKYLSSDLWRIWSVCNMACKWWGNLRKMKSHIHFNSCIQCQSHYGLLSEDIIQNLQPTPYNISLPFQFGLVYVAFPSKYKREVKILKITFMISFLCTEVSSLKMQWKAWVFEVFYS